MRKLLFAAALVAAAGTRSFAYQGGALRPHGHTGPSDGGTLANLAITGQMSAASFGAIVSTNGVTISTGGYLAYNTAGTNELNGGDGVIWAQSLDSVTESSGCVVVGWMSDNTPTSKWVATSTTTVALNQITAGVKFMVLLTNNCAPGSWCQYGTRGRYRVQTDSNGLGSGAWVKTGNTKCQVEGGTGFDSAIVGQPVAARGGTTAANTLFWMDLLGAP